MSQHQFTTTRNERVEAAVAAAAQAGVELAKVERAARKAFKKQG